MFWNSITAPGTGVRGAGVSGACARSRRRRTCRSVAAIRARRVFRAQGPCPFLKRTLQPGHVSPLVRLGAMARIESSSLPSGLPIHRIAIDAGARTERAEENGMAHFLEHLVFKGGEKYDDYRKVNETAERMGAVLNAYTSHDLVAFHITCRAEVA